MNRPQIDPAVIHPDVALNMDRPLLDDIPHYDLPAGYRMRTFVPGDEPIWTHLQRAAEPILNVTDELFDEQYGDNRTALPERMLFIETDESVAVASISAWWETRDFDEPSNRGRIHWVAVHPAHQRRGLTKPMMTWALETLADHHEAAMLGTSSSRPWALKVYLDCGFVPAPADLERADTLAGWQSVQDLLNHPTLATLLPAADPNAWS